MIEGEVTEPLRSLLEFESQQHGLPVTYHHESIVRFRSDDPFRRSIDVWVHAHADTREITFPIAGEEIAIKAAVCLGKFDNPVGPVSDAGVPLCYVQGRAILVPFDLEDLESDVPNAVNKLWGVISELAVFPAVGSIRAYSYEDEKKRYASVKAHALTRWADKVRRDLDDNQYDIDQKTREIGELVEKIEEQRAALEHFEHCKPGLVAAEAVQEFASLMKLTPRPYRAIDFDETRLTAETNTITIGYDGQSYDLGRFEVRIEFEKDRLTITPRGGNRVVEGFPHPHVDSSGSPCLGNIGVSLAKLIALKQYPPALVVLDQFLRSYNDGNPYVKIEKYDPNYFSDDDSDYEACYEATSTAGCLDCSDSGCPYYDDRYIRCDEDSDVERCLNCQDCDAWRRRVDSCRADAVPKDCVTCDRSACPYANDENACREAVDPSECVGCTRSDCAHYQKKEEADAESADRPAGAGTHPALRGPRARRGVGAGDRRAG